MSLTETQIDALPYRPCVGLMILNNSSKIFAGQRIDNASDAWQMPQGGIDPGEQPIEAALRELREETGIESHDVQVLRESDTWLNYELPTALVPRLWNGKYRGQTQRWFALRYGGSDSGIRIDTEIPEFRNWSWMPPDELLTKIVPFKRDTYHQVFQEFRSLIESDDT